MLGTMKGNTTNELIFENTKEFDSRDLGWMKQMMVSTTLIIITFFAVVLTPTRWV